MGGCPHPGASFCWAALGFHGKVGLAATVCRRRRLASSPLFITKAKSSEFSRILSALIPTAGVSAAQGREWDHAQEVPGPPEGY